MKRTAHNLCSPFSGMRGNGGAEIEKNRNSKIYFNVHKMLFGLISEQIMKEMIKMHFI